MYETRSIVRGCSAGRGRGCGRGGHDSPPLTHRKSPIQEESREENHGQEHADSEEANDEDYSRVPISSKEC